MEPTMITVTGARGGHGASTIAAALALFAAGHGRTILTAHDPDTVAALLGLPATDDDLAVSANLTLVRTATLDTDVHVHDAGLIEHVECAEGIHLAVLRGPCYLGLRTLGTRSAAPPDGIVLIHEHDRSLTARDVTDVTGLPVLATVAVAPVVARSIDAGVLPIRLHRLTQFAALRRYITRLLAPTDPLPDSAQTTPASPPPATPEDTPKIGTDLPVPLCGTGRGLLACRAAVSMRAYPSRTATVRRIDAQHRSAQRWSRRVLRDGRRRLGGGLLRRSG